MPRFLSPVFKAAALGKYPYPAVSIADLTVNEDVGTANVVVSIPQASPYTAYVQYTTNDGTAVAGTDYTATSGTAEIPAGSTSTTVDVAITNRGGAQGSRDFTVDLSNPTNATLTDAQATVTINDV